MTDKPQTAEATNLSKPRETGKGLAALLARPGSLVVLLAVLTIAVFWRVIICDFLNYDDPVYVTANSHVQRGLSLNGLAWAFTTVESSNWHPLTWLSHMLDVELFGLKPAGPHVVNLLLHAANTVLLFLVLRQLTGAHWRSGFVAALFALHPLHVESVAWISERKDVLSTFFFLLTLMAYGRYVQESEVQSPKSKVWYGWALVYFVLGLMSKPMVVTVPFVLLLLDYWPLNRMPGPGCQVSGARGQVSGGEAEIGIRATLNPPLSTIHSLQSTFWLLVREKIPFLAVSAIFCVITLFAQTGVMAAVKNVPVGARAANAIVSYARYLGKTFWPTTLALPYQHPRHWPMMVVALSAILLIALSAGAVWLGRKRPFVAVGWFWFLGTLVPVIGLVQVGIQAMADRYSYVPLIGLFIVVSWGAAAALAQWHLPKMTAVVAGVLVLGACALRTMDQLQYWRNGETLFRHTIAVTKNNSEAYDNLGYYLYHHGRTDEALQLFAEALRIDPADYTAYNNIALHFYTQGRLEEAIANYRQALRINPNDAIALNDLGGALLRRQEYAEAIQCLQAALRLKPNFPEAHNNLGAALGETGRTGEAIQHFAEALRLAPNNAEAHNNFATAVLSQGKVDLAIEHYREAIKLNPHFTAALNNLGAVLAGAKRYPEAVDCYSRVVELNTNDAAPHKLLGGILAQMDRTRDAVEQFEAALRLAPNDPETHLALGKLLEYLGRRGEAITHFKEALRLNPDDADAKKELQALGVVPPE